MEEAGAIVTGVPTGPLVGLRLRSVGLTLNVCGLVSTGEPVVAVTGPVSAPVGTVAKIKVEPVRLMVSALQNGLGESPQVEIKCFTDHPDSRIYWSADPPPGKRHYPT